MPEEFPFSFPPLHPELNNFFPQVTFPAPRRSNFFSREDGSDAEKTFFIDTLSPYETHPVTFLTVFVPNPRDDLQNVLFPSDPSFFSLLQYPDALTF